MNEFFTVLMAVLPVFGIMGVGFWLRRITVLTADADQSLMRVTINLLLPSLIFDSVRGNAALQQPENLLLPPVLGFGMAAVGFFVARGFCGLAGLQTGPEKRTFIFLTGLQNYGYLAIPLCLSLYGRARWACYLSTIWERKWRCGRWALRRCGAAAWAAAGRKY